MVGSHPSSGRRDIRSAHPKGHDPYGTRRKPEDAMRCDRCGVVFHGGRWSWDAGPLCDEKGGLCPACQRIRDGYAAGTLRLRGVPEKYRDEVLAMMRHVEEREKREHPLERLMGADEREGEIVATTTGVHLARSIATALGRRFHEGLSIRYLEGDTLVQVDWTAP